MVLSPDKLDHNGFMAYLRDAVNREQGDAWDPPSYIWATWTKQIKRLLEQDVPKYLIALGLDLLSLDWDTVSQEHPWQAINPDRLLTPFRDANLPLWFWSSVWWSRFADEGQEVTYYQYWLLEAAYAHHQQAIRAEVVGREALKRANETMMTRSKPTFDLHWLKDWRETWN